MMHPVTYSLPSPALSARLGPSRSRPLVAYGCQDHNIYVYNNSNNNHDPTSVLEGLSTSPTALAFDAPQERLVGGDEGGNLAMFDLSRAHLLRQFGRGHVSQITGTDVSLNGQLLASISTDKDVRVWDLRANNNTNVLHLRDANAPLCAVAFSPNTRWLASGDARGVVRVYDTQAGKLARVMQLHTGAITSLQFHPDTCYVAASSGDGTISIWNMEKDAHEFRSSSVRTPIDVLRFCGMKLVAASDHRLHAYNLARYSAEPISSVEAPWAIVGDVGYAPMSEEVLFVEVSESSATTGRIPLGGGRGAPADARAVEGGVDAGRSAGAAVRSPPPAAAPTAGVEVARDLLQSSNVVSARIRARVANLGTVRSLWAQNPLDAFDHLRRVYVAGKDAGAMADFLTAMQQQRMKERVSVEVLADLLDLVCLCLQSPEDVLVKLALRTLRSMNTKFRPRLEEQQQRRSADGGAAEEALLKLSECAAQLREMSQRRRDSIGADARAIAAELPAPSSGGW